MKNFKFCFGAALLLVLSSCSPTFYQQISKLSSNEVTMESDGSFSADENGVVFSYDFWSKGGDVSFSVYNKTDDDIYIDFSKSFLIINGLASDYFSNATYTVTNDKQIIQGNTSSVVVSENLKNNIQNRANFPTQFMSTPGTLSLGKSASEGMSYSQGYSVQYHEKPIVCIPAHGGKCFSKLSINAQLYRKCGFDRFPTRNNESEINFTQASSPTIVENRITLKKGEEYIPVNHTFYISSIKNVLQNQVIKRDLSAKNCKGQSYYYLIHILKSSDSFYLVYPYPSYSPDFYDDKLEKSPSSKSKQTKVAETYTKSSIQENVKEKEIKTENQKYNRKYCITRLQEIISITKDGCSSEELYKFREEVSVIEKWYRENKFSNNKEKKILSDVKAILY